MLVRSSASSSRRAATAAAPVMPAAPAGIVSTAALATAALATAALATAALATGCGCGAVAPLEGLRVQIDVSGGTLPDGTYTIVAVADGVTLSVDDVLAPSGVTDGGRATATDGVHTLSLDGALFPSQGAFTIAFDDGGGPAKVSLEIRRGTTVLAHGEWTPTYMTVEPNGPGCGTGLAANATLPLTVP